MNIGGMEFPRAFTAQASVKSVPRSAEVTAPTCLTPFLATIYSGFCTVVIPVCISKKLCYFVFLFCMTVSLWKVLIRGI